jgi:hypothetical protein
MPLPLPGAPDAAPITRYFLILLGSAATLDATTLADGFSQLPAILALDGANKPSRKRRTPTHSARQRGQSAPAPSSAAAAEHRGSGRRGFGLISGGRLPQSAAIVLRHWYQSVFGIGVVADEVMAQQSGGPRGVPSSAIVGAPDTPTTVE